ncbi:MAG: PilZ domain-containing protein [Burkholderiales bacterium]
MRAFLRHPSDIPIEIARNDHEIGERLSNVSFGGLACESHEFLEQDTVVQIRVPTITPSFATTGKVVWCKKRNGDYDVGIQFLDESDLFLTRMVEQLCHIELYRKEVRESEGRQLSGEEAAREWILKYAHDFPAIE